MLKSHLTPEISPSVSFKILNKYSQEKNKRKKSNLAEEDCAICPKASGISDLGGL